MNKKTKSHKRGRDGAATKSVLTELINEGFLDDSLPSGLKGRLGSYLSMLAATTDSDLTHFDSEVLELLKKYVYDVDVLMSEVEYLNSLKDDQGRPFSRTYREPSMYQDALDRFAQANYTSFRWNEWYRQSLEEMKEEFSQFHLSPLVFNSDVAIRDNLPRLDTHSGFTFLETGKKKKGWHMVGILGKFKAKLEEALKRGSFHRPILINFRHQASGEYDDQGNRTGTFKRKARVVSMIDLYVIIAELQFSKPLQQKLASIEFYGGGYNDGQISALLSDWRYRFMKWLSVDYSSFDQTISNWLIEDTFDVIKCAFDMNEEQLAAFEIVKKDFIKKTFITRDGLMKSVKGVPSGSMFTQLDDTLVNNLVIRTFLKFLGALAKMMIVGDDNIVFTDEISDPEQLASYIKHNFGLIIKTDDKTSYGTRAQDPKFLSKYWTLGGTWRHPNQLISRMLFPERERRYGWIPFKHWVWEEDDEGNILSVDRVYDYWTNPDNGKLEPKPTWVGPEHTILGYIAAYKVGMYEFMDVARFKRDFNLTDEDIKNIDPSLLPGYLAYQANYL